MPVSTQSAQAVLWAEARISDATFRRRLKKLALLLGLGTFASAPA